MLDFNLISQPQIRNRTYEGKRLGTDPKETMLNLGQDVSQDIHQSINSNRYKLGGNLHAHSRENGFINLGTATQ